MFGPGVPKSLCLSVPAAHQALGDFGGAVPHRSGGSGSTDLTLCRAVKKHKLAKQVRKAGALEQVEDWFAKVM